MKILASVFLIAVSAATSANAGWVSKTMVAGSKLELYGYFSVNPDCTSLGDTVIRVATPPAHGVIGVHKGRSFPNFNSSNIRYVCNTHRVPSIIVEYRPQPGFVGTDSVMIEAIFPNGEDRTDTYNVIVK